MRNNNSFKQKLGAGLSGLALLASTGCSGQFTSPISKVPVRQSLRNTGIEVCTLGNDTTKSYKFDSGKAVFYKIDDYNAALEFTDLNTGKPTVLYGKLIREGPYRGSFDFNCQPQR